MIRKSILLALVAAVAVFAAPALAIASEDAYGYVEITDAYGDGFTTNGSGTMHVILHNAEQTEAVITVTIKEGGRVLADRVAFTVPAGEQSYRADISLRISGIGAHELTVSCESQAAFLGDISELTATIEVTESIWSKWTTYVAIIIVAAIILIGAYLAMRGAPSKKADVTFTELERQKAAPKKEEPSPAPATERKRYKAEKAAEPPKKKDAPAPRKEEPAPPEKKAESFTELEKRKAEKAPEAPKKKDAPAPRKEEPAPKREKAADGGKIKYKSARRK
ncbi:MAG: hypothetical protein LBG62_02390 [Candidatus Methanoplasma sp.]|jgi:hypothetical protein|nr:hypothetical protein [Candidatus Methanoplasma sp.]